MEENSRTRFSQLHRHIREKISESHNNDDFIRARDWAFRGLKHLGSSDTNLRASYLNEIGNAYAMENRPFDAYQFYVEASRICTPNDTIWNTVNINLGKIFLEWNRLNDAQGYFGRVNDSLMRKDLRGYISFKLAEARLEYSRGNVERALGLVKFVIIPRIFTELSESRAYSKQSPYGPMNVSQWILASLLDYANYSFQRYIRVGDVQDIKNIFTIYKKASRYKITPVDKIEWYGSNGSLKISIARGWTDNSGLANESDIKGMINLAKTDFFKCLSMSKRIADRKRIASAEASLSLCYRMLQKPLRAEKLAREAIDLYDQIMASVTIPDIRVDISEPFHIAVDDLCFLLISQGKLSDSLGYSDVAKARETIGNLTKNSIAISKTGEHMIDTLNELSSNLQMIAAERDRIERKLSFIPNDSALQERSRKLQVEFRKLFDAKRDAEDRLWRSLSDPLQFLPKSPREVIEQFLNISKSASKTHDHSNNDRGLRWILLEYSYLRRESKLVVFVLDYKGDIDVITTHIDANKWLYELPSLVEAFRKSFNEKSYPEAEEALLKIAARLREEGVISDEVVQKLKDLRIEQILLVPDGILHAMPFELASGTSDLLSLDECWAIKYRLVRGFSINHFLSSMKISSDYDKNRVLIIGNPTDIEVPLREVDPLYDSDILCSLKLPGAECEAKIAAELVNEGGGQSELLLKNEASKQRFIDELNKNSYSIVHFAGHAKFDNANPDHSYLLFTSSSGDKTDRLFANEIPSKVYLRGRPLVILSSCESGTARIKIGNEAFGLIRGFSLAGASNLLLSGWKVFDDSAKEFVELFYGKLLSANTVSEALSYARSEVMKRSAENRYAIDSRILHWAPFQLWGNPYRKYTYAISI